MPPFDETRADVAPDGEHTLRTLRALRTALGKVPFYARQSLEAPDADAPLDRALAALALICDGP